MGAVPWGFCIGEMDLRYELTDVGYKLEDVHGNGCYVCRRGDGGVGVRAEVEAISNAGDR